MKEFLIVCIIIQLLSTAYGITVIESVNKIVRKRIYDKGYVQKNNNSLYDFSEILSTILRSFIPLYYFTKALSLLSNKNAIDNEIENEPKTGKYISKNDINIKDENISKDENEELNTDYSIFKGKQIFYEKPEKYVARKNDIKIFDPFETPIEYIKRETEKENNLEITPFKDENEIVEHVMVKEAVTKEDISKAIAELDSEELDILKEKIIELSKMKKQNMNYKLEKDVA